MSKSPGSPVSGEDQLISERVPYWLSAIAGVLILAFGVYAAVTTARIVYSTYTPIIFWDQWEIVNNVMQSGGRLLPLSVLWAQQNEHRIVVGRLAGLADLYFFGGNNVSLLLEIYLVQVGSALVFLWMFQHFGRFPKAVLITVAGLFTFCMLCPLQIENFIWGFQITFVFAEFAAAIAFASMVCYSASTAVSNKRWISTPLVLSFVAGFLAECSLADGVFIWPVLVLLAVALRLPRRIQLLTTFVGASAVSLYLYHYRTPPYHTPLMARILEPLPIVKYVTTYFGSSWDPTLPSPQLLPTFSEIMTLLAIAGALMSMVWLFCRRDTKPDPLRSFLAANLLFAIVTAVITSMGRLDFGVAEAISSRYQVIALFFWASLGAFVLASLGTKYSRTVHMLEVQILLLILMTASIPRFTASEENAKAHQTGLVRGYAALEYDPANREAIQVLYPSVDNVRIWYAFLRSKGWGPDPHKLISDSRYSKILTFAVPHGTPLQLVSPNLCVGFLDGIQPLPAQPDKVAASGWAWDKMAKKPPDTIVLTTAAGLVGGYGKVDTPRPDVQAALNIPGLRTGWHGEALVRHGSQLQAFAVLADSKSICPLSNPIKVP